MRAKRRHDLTHLEGADLAEETSPARLVRLASSMMTRTGLVHEDRTVMTVMKGASRHDKHAWNLIDIERERIELRPRSQQG